jgi:hypothetical protein
MSQDEQQSEIIREYEQLRKHAQELKVQSALVKRQMAELELFLPDQYSYPGDMLPDNKGE